MEFGKLIDLINTYQKLESLLFAKEQKQDDHFPCIELQEEIREIVKKIEGLRGMEI